MRHIFLTGEIQIGKSTAIERTLALLGASYGGFRTYFGGDRASPERRLYLCRAGEPPRFDEPHVVVRFRGRGVPPDVLTERFDTLGTQYVLDAAREAELIVMDELGSLESGAERFRRAVLDALGGAAPILGVVKLSAAGWEDEVRAHPDVSLITVDRENRGELPERLARELRRALRAREEGRNV